MIQGSTTSFVFTFEKPLDPTLIANIKSIKFIIVNGYEVVQKGKILISDNGSEIVKVDGIAVDSEHITCKLSADETQFINSYKNTVVQFIMRTVSGTTLQTRIKEVSVEGSLSYRDIPDSDKHISDIGFSGAYDADEDSDTVVLEGNLQDVTLVDTTAGDTLEQAKAYTDQKIKDIDYENLKNKPQINGIELVGNTTIDYATQADIDATVGNIAVLLSLV